MEAEREEEVEEEVVVVERGEKAEMRGGVKEESREARQPSTTAHLKRRSHPERGPLGEGPARSDHEAAGASTSETRNSDCSTSRQLQQASSAAPRRSRGPARIDLARLDVAVSLRERTREGWTETLGRLRTEADER